MPLVRMQEGQFIDAVRPLKELDGKRLENTTKEGLELDDGLTLSLSTRCSSWTSSTAKGWNAPPKRAPRFTANPMVEHGVQQLKEFDGKKVGEHHQEGP